MTKYLVQLTAEGGVDGVRVVSGDNFEVSGESLVIFAEGRPVFGVSEFKVICELSRYAEIESDTSALLDSEE
jgi:hypothetical protein